MTRVKISRWINHRLLKGSPNEMVSSRVYREEHYGWMLYIDWWFYTLRGEKKHCFRSHIWERRYGKKETKTVFQEERETDMTQKKFDFMFSQEFEYDFTDLVPCDHCGAKKSLTQDMVEVRKYTNSEPINLRFCGEHCANEYHLNRLREVDGR